MHIDLLIIAGEASGDLHGSHLLKSLFNQNPNLNIAAVSGPKMREFPIRTIVPMENLQVMGFTDVFKALPRLLKMFFLIRKQILSLNPPIVLMIDYAEFNLRMAKSLRKKGFQGKLIQYICPTVWAWRQKRTNIIAEHFNQLLTLFPFETKWFEKTTLPVKYVGHPLAFTRQNEDFTRQETPLLALFPGSRLSEIEKNLPLQLKTAKKLLEIHPELQVGISITQKALLAPIQKIIQLTSPEMPIQFYTSENQKKLFQSCKLALAKSGTITLELALYQIPTIVHFAISPLDLWIAKKIFKIHLRFYCIVNILLEEEAFPELFGPHFTEENMFYIANQFWQSETLRQNTISLCQKLPALFNGKNPSEEITKVILHQK